MKDRPNVLLILTDQHRRDTVGCYGAPQCQTPHIDGLAQRGIRFDHAYPLISPCAPSRAGLFTGRYGHITGVETNGGRLDRSLPNLATELPRTGYQLGYSGKWHVDNNRPPSEWGFRCTRDFPGYGYPANNANMPGVKTGPSEDSLISQNYLDYLREKELEPPALLKGIYGTGNPDLRDRELAGLHAGGIDHNFEALVASETIEHLEHFAQRDEPFFMWANFWGPHSPCIVPEPYYSMYDPRSIPEDPAFKDDLRRRPYAQTLVSRYWGIDPDNWEAWQEIVARYWGYVTMIDDLVGRMLGALDRLGLTDDTIILFSTDHGDNMGAHKLFEKGPYFDDECFRLPLIGVHPECTRPGGVVDEFVYMQDLFPSLVEAAGLEVEEQPDTQSILPLLMGREESTRRDSAYCQFSAQIQRHPSRMVRTRTHKFVFSQADMGELYDLQKDPHELNNLFGLSEYQDKQEELMVLMESHMERVNDSMLGVFKQVRHIY
ncbi:MAG: sulfatase-like hydrolase/transferase [Candidatus Latescibacteria bacterium]|jgi:arylsulfatase A-like enzyme|nr:sulfatase-like hydrolase/transferase [Candidatus Latescibacterota bacterium]